MIPIPKLADKMRIYIANEKLESAEVLETLLDNREEEEAALLTAKKLLKSRFNRARQPTNADRILGETVIVTEEINNEKPSGQIRAGSIFWTARSIDGTVIPKDAEVTVKYIDGVKAKVERA